MKINKDSVNYVSPRCDQWLIDSRLPRTLLQGTRGMKMAQEIFLPKNLLEKEATYLNRLERSTLLNAFRKTVSFLTGQVFQADVIFADSVADSTVDYNKNIDGYGNNLNVFAKRVFFNGLGKGVSHILVDTDEVAPDENRSVAEEKLAGIRPYFREIRPEDLIGFRSNENGTLKQVRILQSVSKQDGLYGEKEVPIVRIYNDDGTWEVHERQDDGEFVKTKSGMLRYKGIPIATFIPGEESSRIHGETPLMDLAELNLHHWRSSSDQSNILHVARVPILFARHVSLDVIPVGVATMINSEEDGSELKYVEITGQSIEAGAKDIKECEAKMALWGLQQLLPRSGNITATEKAITSSESSSSLGTWATEFESVLQQAYTIAEWFGGDAFPEAGVVVNKEYNLGIANEGELNVLLNSVDRGVLSAQSCFSEMRKRGIVSEHLTWELIKDEKSLEEQEAPSGLAGTLFGDTTAQV